MKTRPPHPLSLLAVLTTVAISLHCPAVADEASRKPDARKLRAQLIETQKELEHNRASLHEAHKELARKAEAISTLESRADSLAKQLATRARTEADEKKEQTRNTDALKAAAAEISVLKERLAQVEGEARVLAQKSAAEIRRKTLEVAALQSALDRVQSQAAAALAASRKNTPDSKKPTAPPKIAPLLYGARSAAPPDDWQRVLREARAVLKQYPKATLTLTGHADDAPYAETNRDISQNRARFLADHLVSAGIPQDRLETKGLGHTRAAKGSPASNRRVDIEVRP